MEHERVDTMNRQASLGVLSSVQSSLSKTREGISKDVPLPPPLASKKKITSERGGSGQELIRRVF